ncbi:DUF6384 family protein, partial [Elioraea rosea]|uniref:DUF6384 family protein n=1 Tax=Elioraea rosea TaxID=2492390 RepID=UPI00194F9317
MPAQAASPSLDDTMLAMDVVDTIRHAETLAMRELAGEERRAKLRERLREIYASQGITVPEHVLDQGIAALEEKRFAYHRRGDGLGRRIATLWVTRARWGRPTLIALGAALIALVAWQIAVVAPQHRQEAAIERELSTDLPRALRAEHDRVLAGTTEPGPRADAARLLAEGEAAARAGNLAEARARR